MNGKGNPQVYIEYKEPQTAKIILKKKKKMGRFTLSDFKTFRKVTVNKTWWHWHKETYVISGIELTV